MLRRKYTAFILPKREIAAMQKANNIDEVIDQLSQIIDWSIQNNSPLGYFPALYRKVTILVKEKIAENHFDDGKRMEQLDVIFANRYLEAFYQYQNKEKLSESWKVAFDAGEGFWPIVLQHLLLGINAHINLDLAIAAAETSPGKAIESLKDDFDRINALLSSLVDKVEDQLAKVWPLLKILDWVGGRTDEKIINFSIDIARMQSWQIAKTLAKAPKEHWPVEITALDQQISRLGQKIVSPGTLLTTVGGIVRIGELGDVKKKITILEDI